MYILKNFINTLRRYWVSGLLNVMGMAVAFAAFFLILTQVSRNLTFNHKVKDCDRVFLLSMRSASDEGRFTANLIRPFGERLIESTPLIETGGTIWDHHSTLPMIGYTKQGDEFTKISWNHQWIGTPGGFHALGIELAEGAFEKLNDSYSFAVSSDYAQTHDIKLGDYIYLDKEGRRGGVTVEAILKPVPENSDLATIQFASIMPANDGINDYGNWQYPFYLKLRSANDREEVLAIANRLSREICKNDYYGGTSDSSFDCDLISFKDLYYQKTLVNPMFSLGNKSTDISLLAVGILILIIAMVNYVNFFLALIPIRIKSVNTYKIFGHSRKRLVLDFMSESACMVLISLLFSIVLIIIFNGSGATQLLTHSSSIGNNHLIFVLTIAVALTVTLASSIYPALYITKFQPALALKPGFSSIGPGKRLRTGLLGFQFIISIMLIICASFVKLQRDYIQDFDLGFDKENLVTGIISSNVAHYGPKSASFDERLRDDPRIVDVAWADGDIIDVSRMGWGRQYRGKEIWVECYPVSYNFLTLMGIDITDGRNFTEADEMSENGVIIYSEEARRQYDMDMETTPNGHQGPCQLAGFCQDFNFRPLQYEGIPFAFYVFGKHPWRNRLSRIYVRTQAGANPYDVMDFIRKTVIEMEPEIEPEDIMLSTFDESMDKHYRSEKKLSGFLTLFTICSIVLSLMGVFGIVLFDTQHRRREIAIRRVMGSTSMEIQTLFNIKYAKLNLICFIIATPVSWMIIRFYFSHFAYHTEIHWWVFAATLLTVLVMSLAIVTLNVFSATRKNPTESIHQE